MGQKQTEREINELTLFEGLQREDLVYIYRGVFSQVITDSIIALTENNLDSVGESSKLKKRVFSIMVECLQNITRHQFIDGRENVTADQSGLFVVCNKDKAYQMTSGNVVNNDAIPHLKKLLDKVNSLDKDALKDYYKQVLEDGSISSKGGAGLGLIEMARKSGNKLFYTFEELDEEISYFYMNTSISQQLEEAPIDFIDIQDVVSLHKFILQKNIMLIFNGGLNQKSLIDILSLINEQAFGKLERKKKMYNVMVEMLQNVVKHGAKYDESRPGGSPVLFYIGQNGEEFSLNAGNYIENTCIEKVTSKIDLLNSLDNNELDDFYMKSLLDFDVDNSKEAGLGLVDLRMKSGHKITYELTPVNDTISFILMQVTI
ncbi:MAG: SiaB family protein kinase [Bacteroidales bacterium]|nr:SiaB family protein kinase [Bacteroidales bacterium]